ncbi:MFS transporter [Bacillus taeanensis]|uniref:MFS transporter n=1 Tax=Bacillus taeanensis TaxID=273032 RepID=A0A366XW93_9BACI|nr:MFS transporter [Bacillus taeanensis]RBW69039.1 MFS transporter [Bacillus taeanensis]
MELTRQQTPLQTRFYYGWVIVGIAALGVFFSGPGQTYSISVFIDYYIQDFGWSRSLVSTVYSAATLAAGLLLFIIGRLVDRFGQRFMSAAVGIMLAIACFWNSAITGSVMLFIGFFMIRLFGQGSMTLIPNTLVPQWFIEKRGRALSLMAIGGFLSSAALPPINAWLIETWSWETAWRVWGILLFLIYVPLALFFIRNRPEDSGMLPDGKTIKKVKKGTKSEEEVFQEENWTLKEAMKTRAFWFILICVGIPALVNTGLTFHLVSILGENGLKPTTAAFVLSLMAIVGFPVTFLAGYALDKFKVHMILGLSFIGQLLFLLLVQWTNTVLMAIIFGVVWGAIIGFERIALNIVWPNYFGREHLGSIKGIAMTATVIGSAFGPLPFGIAYDFFGGYTEIIYLSMFFPILGILLAISSPKPEK